MICIENLLRVLHEVKKFQTINRKMAFQKTILCNKRFPLIWLQKTEVIMEFA
jgi:hypothetical protein